MHLDIDVEKQLKTETGLQPLTCRLQVNAGECLGIEGPSGAGKSSLLKMITGLLRPDRGRITAGADTWFDASGKIDLPPGQRSCGYLQQQPVLFPFLTLEQNLLFARRDREQAALYLQVLGLKNLKDHYPGHLSGGQLKRAALAQLLVLAPRFLLLDEPFASLDRDWVETLLDVLFHYAHTGSRTLVVVSHQPELLARLADRIISLAPGGMKSMGFPNHFQCRKSRYPSLYFSRPAGL